MRVPLVLLFACSKCGRSASPPAEPSSSRWLPEPHFCTSLQQPPFLVALGVFTSVSVRGKGPGALAPGLEGSTVGNLTARSCYSRWRSGGTLMASVDRYERRRPGRLTLAPGWLVPAPATPAAASEALRNAEWGGQQQEGNKV